MDNLDLDAFIADIEQSAPKEEEEGDEAKHRCQECNTVLEEDEGTFVCPNCSAQATNILQLEETELHYNDAGIAIVGQRVMTSGQKKKHVMDYGWAWSTDEAVVHILGLQLDAMERIGLVPDFFKQGVKNMWMKFWVDNIAPYIKDEYDEEELVQISVDSALKLRDVEVLVKVQDKVMLPKRIVQRNNTSTRWKMLGANFYRENNPPEPLPDKSIQEKNDCDELSSSDEAPSPSILQSTTTKQRPVTTRILNKESISILTLNRTLAFIEAAARCLQLADPIFASDIIRLCNQRLIPFFGSHKLLPENMKLNLQDRLMFQKIKPPSPIQLNRAASLLVHKIYSDKYPLMAPVPDLDIVLERFIIDLNLPRDLLNYFKMIKIDFSCFKVTQPIKLCHRRTGVSIFPLYERWAFAILVFHLKRLFVLDKRGIEDQLQAASRAGGDIFVLYDWIRQMSMRLQLIMSYDPYMLFHPMTRVKNLQPTPQIYNYVETLLSDRVLSTTRAEPKKLKTDMDFRSEMTEFLRRQIPRPPQVERDMPDEKLLQKPIHLRHPIQDAFSRTKRFWIPEIRHDREVSELLFKDFTSQKVLVVEANRNWTIYDNEIPENLKHFRIQSSWPYCFKLLLSIGGYLCYCEPDELLQEYRHVEAYAYPHTRILRKTRKLSVD